MRACGDLLRNFASDRRKSCATSFTTLQSLVSSPWLNHLASRPDTLALKQASIIAEEEHMVMRTVAFVLAIQLSVGLLVPKPVSAASKNRPSQAHVAISLGDGKTIEAKKGGKPKALKAKQPGPRKGIRR